MDVASALVYAVPGRSTEVRAQLERMPGLEIHAETRDGRFVVTAEDVDGVSAGDTMIALHRLDGVLAATMVCQYSDSGSDSGETRS